MLELLGRSVDFGCLAPLQKQETKRIGGDRSLPLQCLSQFFLVEEKINCLGNEFLVRSFHRRGGLVFIMDDHDNFPSWMMIQIFLPLCERFSFLIVNRLIKVIDNFLSWMMIPYFFHWVMNFLSLSLTN